MTNATSEAVRLGAANSLVDRAVGKATEPIQVALPRFPRAEKRLGRLAVRDHFHKRTVRRNVDESKNCAIPVARIPSFRYSFDSRRSVRCASR